MMEIQNKESLLKSKGIRAKVSLVPRLSGGGASEEEKESLVQTDRKSAHCAPRNLLGFSIIKVNVISCG